jgi:hypothetical protein
MNYGTLKSTIEDYTHRDDLTSVIPTFILLAQNQLSRRLRTPELYTTATVAVTADSVTATLPTDYMEMKRVTVPRSSGSIPLQQNSLEQNGQIYLEYGGATGLVSHYAIYGNTIEFAPTPSSDVTVTLIYKAYLAEFSADEDTDNILTKFPKAYIYGAMREMALYIRDEKQLSYWGALLDEQIDEINEQGKYTEWSGGITQIRNHNARRP